MPLPLPQEPSGVPAPVLDRLGAAGYRAMIAGVRLGVFTALETGPLSVDELATTIDGDPAGVRSLVNVLLTFGYLRHDDDGITTAATPGPVDAELFWHEVLFEHWADIEDTIRTGTPRRGFYTWLSERPASGARLRRMLAGAAADLADDIAAALPPAATVLDIGGGHGDHSVELCRRRPDVRVTVLDLPETVTALREDAPSDRMTARAGDYLTDDLGSGHDLVLLFNVLHGHRPEECRELFRRAAKSLSPTGSIAILDHDREPPSGLGPAAAGFLGMFDLTLWQGHGGGVHRYADLAAWLGEAGLTETRVVPLAASPLEKLLIAGRPS
ncbi:methyltransferase domain-containing protein [Streptomyces anulatus]|uniref:Methyltransferase domain-containing protein n=1 Tax=Streptomyces anulatus TaxID=1892 RepID=A0A6G3SS37_STRAQ|nr:methyltransferase domain-containing protein [Streptomyces anulatus]